MFEAIVESILQPGVNSQLLTAINIAFVCLLVVLTFMLVTFGFNIHLLMLIIISSGLLLSINWWVKLETDIYWAPILAVYELISYLYKQRNGFNSRSHKIDKSYVLKVKILQKLKRKKNRTPWRVWKTAHLYVYIFPLPSKQSGENKRLRFIKLTLENKYCILKLMSNGYFLSIGIW